MGNLPGVSGGTDEAEMAPGKMIPASQQYPFPSTELVGGLKDRNSEIIHILNK